jgi:hypothetical protein
MTPFQAAYDSLSNDVCSDRFCRTWEDMKGTTVTGQIDRIRKMVAVCAMIVLAETALLVGYGHSVWALPADTTKPGTDETSHDRFWANFKDMRLGPLVFGFGGQVRLRYEYYEGSTLKGYDPGNSDELLLERVRLELATRLWEKPLLFLQLQDAHAFLTQFEDGDFPKSNPIENTLDIRQLYLEWLRIGDSPFGIKLGRQQISYGDQRVFGPGNWGNTGRFAWDAAMLKIETDWLWMDLWTGKFLQYKTSVWPDQSVDNFSTFVTYVGIKNLPLRLDLFYVKKDDRREEVAGESGKGYISSSTVGLQAEGKVGDILSGGATVIGQFGLYGGDEIRAYGANVKLGFAIPVSWNPQIGGQITYGSGDRDPHDGIHGTFDGVYGGRDIYFYGYLNLFFWANLWDKELDLSVHPNRNLAMYLEYHHFALAEGRDAWYTTGLTPYRRDPTGQSGTSLGDEADFRVSWTLWNHLELMGGFGRFFPGDFVSRTGSTSNASWSFLQTAYSW